MKVKLGEDNNVLGYVEPDDYLENYMNEAAIEFRLNAVIQRSEVEVLWMGHTDMSEYNEAVCDMERWVLNATFPELKIELFY